MAQNTKPNIIMMVADDMGYGDFGKFNDGYVKTPHLDSLIDESTCLSQHYSGAPVCSPARAALLTGRYPLRTGVISPAETWGQDRLSTRETTIGDYFKTIGYKTGLIGKWHNGALDSRYHPNNRGFDEFIGFRGGWADFYEWIIEKNGQFIKSDGTYLTNVLGDNAIDFINRNKEQPFFLSLMFNAPHSPLQAPQEIIDTYLQMGLTLGTAIIYAMIEVMDQQVGRILETLKKLNLENNTIVMFSSDNGPAFHHRPDQVPDQYDKELNGHMTRLFGKSQDWKTDYPVQRNEKGEIIAEYRFNCGYNGSKGSVYEGGIKVPMILRWPDGLPKIENTNQLIHFVDWLPTLIAATGSEIKPNLPLDGRNILPILRGEINKTDYAQFWSFSQYPPRVESNAGMRIGPWKLVRPKIDKVVDPEHIKNNQKYIQRDIDYKYKPETVTELMTEPWAESVLSEPIPKPELFNLDNDPGERNNVAEENPEIAKKMETRLTEWFQEVEREYLNIPKEW